MAARKLMAFDLGASGGRGIVGEFDGNRLSLTESFRFSNGPKKLGGKYYWDILSLMDHISQVLCQAGADVESVGVDTWGVDFGLLDQRGNLLGNPRSYRDPVFNETNLQHVISFFGGEEALFAYTHVAALRYTVLSKLYWMLQNEPEILDQSAHLLMLPNLIEYYLTGEIHSEYTIASTSQMYDMKNRCWNKKLMERLNVNPGLFSPVDFPGRRLGNIRRDFLEIPHMDIQVISVAGHDTASAAAAVPAGNCNYAFLSSGTWSLLGAITERLLSGSQVIQNKIGNEGAANGGYRPTINITGLWMIQECKRCWETQGKQLTFSSIADEASACGKLKCFIDPEIFQTPGDYPHMIQKFCRETRQYVPQNEGEIARCVFDSLAMKYRQAFESLKDALYDTDKLYMIGGGVKNRLLNQLTANAIGVPVVTGPSEATIVGNLIGQLQALGEIENEEQAGEIIRKSFASETYEPQNVSEWTDAYSDFCRMTAETIK